MKIRRIIAKFIVDDHQIIYMAGIKKLFIDLPNKCNIIVLKKSNLLEWNEGRTNQ